MEGVLVNSDVKAAVLISSKPGCFIAGADIAMLDAAKSKEEVKISELCQYHSYRIAGNFRMVLNFVFFARKLDLAKIKSIFLCGLLCLFAHALIDINLQNEHFC